MDGSPLPALSLDAVEGLVKIGFALFAGWLFCVGASIGSFLNVVVYRLPLGKNLVTPPSSCPVCGRAIRPRHNVPILGWLMLGGRCFDCRTPISSRYPLVEAPVGTVFLLLGIEFLLGGSNLVDVSREPWGRMPWTTLGRAYALHAVLATTLIGAALIEFDGRRIPPSLFLPSILLSVILPLFASGARPESIWFGERGFIESATEGAAGLAGGALVGLLCGFVWKLCSPNRTWPHFAPAWCLVAVGAALGWRGMVMVALWGTLLFGAILLFLRRRRGVYLPWPACLTVAFMLVVLGYRSGVAWGESPQKASLFSYEIAVANTLLMLAVFAWSRPERFWRRAPRSFPLAHVPADAPPPPAEPSPPEPTHDP